MSLETSDHVRQNLDGCGSLLKHPFADIVRGTGRTFDCAFEWCAGIGEIGMHLLREGLCRRLVLSDINPEAIGIARQIAERDGLTDRIAFHVGDNLSPLPADSRFDLVVGNPPNYYNIQANHPLGPRYINDLRPNDRGWKIHKDFYAAIRHYLEQDALMLIHEVEPWKKEVYIDNDTIPYDVRDDIPMNDFARMTAENGLKITGTVPALDLGGVGLHILKIIPEKKP